MVKIKMGEICRSLYRTANHKPITNMGKAAHQAIISGKVMVCRRLLSCHGKGANKR